MLALAAIAAPFVASPVEQVTFPETFAFGTATAAYQIEGGWREGGRGLSIWDAFSHTPGKIRTGETGDVAADHYHRWRSDVQLMVQMRMRYYRFSISWSRVLPSGYGAVNEEGVRFYSMLIDELISNGIHPVVTLYHWDLPLALQVRASLCPICMVACPLLMADMFTSPLLIWALQPRTSPDLAFRVTRWQVEYDGWLSEATASAFVQYATFCFSRFGDRVKHWITINEPAHHAVYGYARGDHAPGRRLRPTKEPYVAAHHMLLAHAYAVARYRKEFAPKQGGMISIALNSDWREPATDEPADLQAAQRSMEFNLGWFAVRRFSGSDMRGFCSVARSTCHTSMAM